MVDVDIFVTNPTFIDWDVYQLWLKGYTAKEAALIVQKRGISEEYEATIGDLHSETVDMYRLFNKLEYYLMNPQKMPEQQIFIMDAQTKRLAIEYYYQFDDEVVREFLGKKLSTRTRKELDDICERLHVPIRTCRRQFDNVKRIFKEVEDMSGCLVTNIKTHTCISTHLATQYASVLFIVNNRFETSKKRMAYLTFDDFAHCCNLMIQNWSSTTSEDIGLELDGEFVQQLRDTRLLSERDLIDEHKLVALRLLRPKVAERMYHEADSIFKTFSKIIVTIACNLNHSKDLKDFFMDIVEKIIDPLQHLHWSLSDVHNFISAYRESCFTLSSPTLVELLPVWDRFMITMISCIEKMYHT